MPASIDERRVGVDGALENPEQVDATGERLARVLNTNAAVDAPLSISIGAPFRAGDGTPSTIRSSSACVPRFFVATPHATGKTHRA